MKHLILALLVAGCDDKTTDTEPADTAASVAEEACGPDADFGLGVGQCALDFTLPDSTGADFTLSDQRGKVALVDISAVW